MNYNQYNQLNLPQIAKEIAKFWEENNIFQKSITERTNAPAYTFYEGPPSANGLPGIHHVMARSIKDIFCRYKTMKGYKVNRKAGWDTHGLPVELGVEKALGITKEDIGKKISIADYNAACRKDVMKYTEIWNELTKKMGYWVDMQNPYITYENNYIESVWWLLKQLFDKKLLYKGYTIQPYSPAAGTGLSTHELNQPGCYKNVKDTSIVAQFQLTKDAENQLAQILNLQFNNPIYCLAWTTTPWTLPSNTALAVGENITYCLVQTFNPYTFLPITVILAKDLLNKYFNPAHQDLPLTDYKAGDKNIPYQILSTFEGKILANLRYQQLLPYAQPTEGDAFKIILADFVTTDDGTGIVHIAPSFGADDFRVAKQNGIGALTLVDKRGKFLPEVTDFAGEYVKESYLSEQEKEIERQKQQRDKYLSVDERIAIKLKQENKAFKVEKYEHNYPHCWRTDKPVLYYPLDSWFVKVTAAKDKLITLNKTINWKPEATGTGRFGNWLENVQDWNLSRSRFWGIPLPIWTSEDKTEQICIGSVEELKQAVEKSIAAGLMKPTDFDFQNLDLHRPYVDNIVLLSASGKKMYREADLIDVWFDSGAMPYAQWHYPFENVETFKQNFPADFIAEGVDQTRGWFYTLHVIAGLLFDSVAFKNVVSNGLVLDKNGNKMSKRLGNAIDPFETLEKYGPDATRWYMITNAQPWDNLKFDTEGIVEVQKKFFGTLYNTYAFFALYANIDHFKYQEAEIPLHQRPEIDQWILSELNSLIKNVDESYNDYEPTKAGRAIQFFVTENLSNWYVRLCRRRFWKGDYSTDKIAAYQTLYTCLVTVAKLMAPIAPFFADRLFKDLNDITQKEKISSVHLALMPTINENAINKNLEQEMALAQTISSLVLSLRKKVGIRVRQPLQTILLPITDEQTKTHINKVKDLILSEVNVKSLLYIDENNEILVKKIKPNYKQLGPKFGKDMKLIANAIAEFTQNDIKTLSSKGKITIVQNNTNFEISIDDVEITSADITGWQVASEGNITVALDITITEALKNEGIAREIVNRIQNIRKELDFEVTDKIAVAIQSHEAIDKAIQEHLQYICNETLAQQLVILPELNAQKLFDIEIDEKLTTKTSIKKIN